MANYIGAIKVQVKSFDELFPKYLNFTIDEFVAAAQENHVLAVKVANYLIGRANANISLRTTSKKAYTFKVLKASTLAEFNTADLMFVLTSILKYDFKLALKLSQNLVDWKFYRQNCRSPNFNFFDTSYSHLFYYVGEINRLNNNVKITLAEMKSVYWATSQQVNINNVNVKQLLESPAIYHQQKSSEDFQKILAYEVNSSPLKRALNFVSLGKLFTETTNLYHLMRFLHTLNEHYISKEKVAIKNLTPLIIPQDEILGDRCPPPKRRHRIPISQATLDESGANFASSPEVIPEIDNTLINNLRTASETVSHPGRAY